MNDRNKSISMFAIGEQEAVNEFAGYLESHLNVMGEELDLNTIVVYKK